MARIRTIKPEFFRNHKLYKLEKETGLPIRVAFAGLWTTCDREGRFEWVEEELKLDCLPYDEVDFSRVLDALVTRGFVVKYAVNERDFGYVPGFLEHQVVNNREKDSTIPQYIDNNEELTGSSRVLDACSTPLNLDQGEGKGREGKGIEERYRFAGLVIRLNEKDYGELKTKYARIPDFDLELEAADKQYANDPKIQKNWFIVLNNRLNSKHQQFMLKPQIKAAEPVKRNVTHL
jgi:hypothetical protein